MKNSEDSFKIPHSFGYCCAVAASSLCFVILFESLMVVSSLGSETATNFSFAMKAFELFAFTVMISTIGCLFSFITSIIPFLIGLAIAIKFRIHSPVYFIVGGAITGGVLCPLFLSIPNFGFNVQNPEPDSMMGLIVSLSILVLSGAVAGWTYWRLCHRKKPSRA
ncbi:hypothetical protein [Glaciimonas soli]|uniref:Uncharacterized protein n=1 Tax=Glaciimonas soli TaxID=2590999 RepID=A0A843YVK8_9BURK|nr:hypothetical protein [Glaciimonas soli]MQR00636.1 hypothetical protein [Glaciimonas soli]